MPLELSLVLCAFADLFVKTVRSLVSCFRESWTFSVQKYDILSFFLSFFLSFSLLFPRFVINIITTIIVMQYESDHSVNQ